MCARGSTNLTVHFANDVGIVLLARCASARYGDRIYQQIRKMGVSVDWDRAAFTMDEVGPCTRRWAPAGVCVSDTARFKNVTCAGPAAPQQGRRRGVCAPVRSRRHLPLDAIGELVLQAQDGHLQY